MKKKIWILAAIVVVIFILIGVYDVEHPKSQAVDLSHACAINFLQTFIFDVPIGTAQTTVASELLTQLLNQYESMPQCYTLGITDYSITSIGKPSQVQKDFTIPVTFDVVPLSPSQTVWAMASTTWDGAWVRGERVTLGITDTSTTTATKSYRLVLQ